MIFAILWSCLERFVVDYSADSQKLMKNSIESTSVFRHSSNEVFLMTFLSNGFLSVGRMNTSEKLIKKQKDKTPKKGRPLGYDPEEMLETAMQLFWTGGYDATSLDDILSAANISKSSFYHMFGSKQQLFERCLGRYCDRQLALIEDGLQQSSTGRDFIEALLYGLVDAARKKEERYKGCFVTNTIYEFVDRDENISKLISGTLAQHNQLLQAAIKKGQAEGLITKQKTPKVLASFLMCSIAGIRTMIFAKVEIDQLVDAVDVALAALD
ncbi:TetR/AcrR family transcriptional regulator [Nitrosomonas sp.]|uniref:TetR/AcrR family transcriptional regulator n=1 Tax=Nitrosomonas sp. TaxID=42353 RepID=UPI001DF4DD78|nr:TetR/AcrR family transcriptional regulator [Nitrosomonas sp.]MCB1947657.1 TetR/AcrR family transcriptional regulator [Nitrosomonas sp.]MDR4513300.1 TetR/AcrR family transcriptional regulator [Nitrosomonas sp.]